MNHPRGAVVPRCFVCNEPLTLIIEPADCIAISVLLPRGKYMAVWIHWEWLRVGGEKLHGALLGQYGRCLNDMAAARIERGLPADPRMN